MVSFSQKERREFTRHKIRKPIRFKFATNHPEPLRLGTIENISESGLLFRSRVLPRLSSLIWVDFDRNIESWGYIKRRACVTNNGILARIVRLQEEVGDESYRIGACFETLDVAQEEAISFS